MHQMVVAEGGATYIGCALQKDRYTLIEKSPKSRITCMQYSQKNFMRIIGNEQKNNGQDFWEILERIIGKILSIIGAGLHVKHRGMHVILQCSVVCLANNWLWLDQSNIASYGLVN